MSTTKPTNSKPLTGPGHAGIYGPIKTDITDGGTNLFNVAHPNDGTVAFMVLVAIHANDAADQQARIEQVMVAGTNDAGVWASQVQVAGATDGDGDAASNTGGSTLTVVYALSGANPAVFSITPTGSLVETSYYATWTLFMLCDNAVTIL